MTIYDIAQEAGVSPATVSRVLTSNARVSDAKRSAVERVIRKYDFKPNAAAQSLHTGVKILGIMAEDMRNPYNAALEVECERAANELGYTILLCNVFDDPEIYKANLENLHAHRVCAIIQISGILAQLFFDPKYRDYIRRITKTIPFISTGTYLGKGINSLRVDQAEGMRMVMEYLVSLGHRKIAFAGAHNKWMEGDIHERLWKFFAVHEDLHIPFQKKYIVDIKNGDMAEKDILLRLLKDQDRPTAIIALNDYIAVQIMDTAREAGLSIPRDISLISFDNTFITGAVYPKLSSVDYNYPEFGRHLVKSAIMAANGEKLPKVQYLSPRVVVRDSCAAPLL